MSTKEEEYREIFLTEAIEQVTEINRLLTALEKDTTDVSLIKALFRHMHTLKGNATGMGYAAIAEITHVLEDLFAAVRDGRMAIHAEMFTAIYRAADILSELVHAIKHPKNVSYRGIKTKLEVMLRAAIAPEVTSPVENIPVEKILHHESIDTEDEDRKEDARIIFSDLVQVPVQKLDNLLNLVGELVIERDRLLTALQGNRAAQGQYTRFNRMLSDLQYSVMDVRLVQVDFLFNKFHRIVRDAAALEGKQVALQLEGTDTELDRNILQVISDSLIHLIRNAVCHGIEAPEKRVQTGKPERGTITLSAANEADAVIITIQEDGAGIDLSLIKRKAIEKGIRSQQEIEQLNDHDIRMLIFESGFSTLDEVTTLAGRGVGMDVVKKALDSIGGSIQLESEFGTGTTFRLSLPASMAVKSALLFELGEETFAIPLSYTESVTSIYRSAIHPVSHNLFTVYLGKTIPLFFLGDILQNKSHGNTDRMRAFHTLHAESRVEIIIVSFHGKQIGLIVDKLLQQKEIIEKPLSKPVEDVSFVSGVTILGNGRVCLVLSVPGILYTLQHQQPNKRII
ncbi:MAG TPA: chemotaxis protein CheA [Ohtaekwangia sp.]|uniref:chemotaxis protein CheA n=1 Tax=Ohtaekwangia sp. TaxID=2066019 RepID=UPI002F94D42A